MFQQKSGKNGPGIQEINMTPLIDVSLVLVVMLLLATPLTFESSIAVHKSAVSAQEADRVNGKERIELEVISEEGVKVNRTLVARAALVETLQPLLEASSPGQVVVACVDSVSHRAFVDVLDKAKICGATNISVMGR
jgi:biopolymer transport protein ExbD